jgi:hypothetical protein
MRQRVLQVIGVAITLIVVSLAMTTLKGQAPTSAQKGPGPKTSWGEPDLQGIWGIEYQIPLQRPAKYKDKAFFTDAELAQLDNDRVSKPFLEKRAERGTEKDVAGAYDSRVFTTQRRTGRRTSLIVDPPDGLLPPLTPRVQARNKELREFQLAHLEATEACKQQYRGCEGGKYTGVASPRMREPYKYYPSYIQVNRADGPEDHGLSMRCMSGNLPDLGGGGFGGGIWQIAQAPGAVSIFYDTGQGQGWHRPIHVDGSAHLPASIRLWWGDSRAHWEGNTLVVDVTNFSGKTIYQGSTENLHLVERWTRTDPTSIEYKVTVDDPTTWTKPWTAVQDLNKQSDKANRVYKEPRCVEGNYSIYGWLAGARAKEQAFAEGRGPDPATINYATSTTAALDSEELDEFTQ